MDRMIFVSDDETSTCYVENKLSAPQGGVRKKVKLLYPLQCHNAATARKARGGKAGVTVRPWLPQAGPWADYTKGQPQPACALPRGCRGHGCCCKARFNHSAPEEDSWQVAEGHSCWSISHSRPCSRTHQVSQDLAKCREL